MAEFISNPALAVEVSNGAPFLSDYMKERAAAFDSLPADHPARIFIEDARDAPSIEGAAVFLAGANAQGFPIPSPVHVDYIREKKNKSGKKVNLTNEMQDLLKKLREGSPIIIDCLEASLQMLGVPEPGKEKPWLDHRFSISDQKEHANFVKTTKRLYDVFQKILHRDWEDTAWEDDWELITLPWGYDPKVDLYYTLWDHMIELGRLAGAYVPKGSSSGTWERTWPQDGSPDARPQVEVYRRIHVYIVELMKLTKVAEDVHLGQMSFFDKMLWYLQKYGESQTHFEPPTH